MTQVVMESAPVARPIASSAYSFLRFCGGAIAPFIAGKLAEHVSVGSPFYLGVGMTAIAAVVLWAYRDALRPVHVPARAGSLPHSRRRGAMVVAVAGATARQVSAMAVPLARARGQAVHVVNVIETDVLAAEDTAELETRAEANALLDACIGELRAAGSPTAPPRQSSAKWELPSIVLRRSSARRRSSG
jgi:hypothetical protein